MTDAVQTMLDWLTWAGVTEVTGEENGEPTYGVTEYGRNMAEELRGRSDGD